MHYAEVIVRHSISCYDINIGWARCRDRARPTDTSRRCVVLSDRERETLDQIQRRLLVEDPGFAQSFDADAQRLP
ncbi:MAG: DUF3040 domain-containing protein, partial [Pseudonocardiaceae bacterium]